MKSKWNKLAVTAAALTIVAGVAGAQTFRAEIPFAFQAGGKVMAPGTYELKIVNPTHHVVMFANYDAKMTALLMATGLTDSGKTSINAAPALVFDCGIGRCALARLWTGSANPALTFHHPDLGTDTRASLTEIRLVKMNGD